MKLKTLIPIFLVTVAAMGCRKAPTWDDAVRMQKDGQYAPAVKVFSDFLLKHPETSLKDQTLLALAQCEEGLGDYPKAAGHYQQIIDGRLGGDLEIKAYLGLGNLYRDHLNDKEKALDAYERALSAYLNESDIRDAIRMLVDAKLQTVDALYGRKDFQDAARMARAILDSYPDTYLSSDARAKAQWLVDRVDRSGRVQAASSDQMFVVKEMDNNPESASDFNLSAPVTGIQTSPDGKYQVILKKRGAVSSLYLGAVGGVKTNLRLVLHSTGAAAPVWSPRSDSLVFIRVVGTIRKLEHLDPKTGKTLDLFFTKKNTLGRTPVFDPSGSKVAFLYDHSLWVVNADGTNVTKLKTEKPAETAGPLAWSADETLIRYRTVAVKGAGTDRLLVLDAGIQRP